MKKIFLIEQFWGDDSTITYILGDTPYFIIYPKWFKQLQQQRRVNGLHYTDVDGLKKLISLQNSSKVISATNKISLDIFKRGIETKGGVCAIVSGQLLLHNTVDSFSKKDKYGRRWIPYNIFDDKDLRKEIIKASQKVCLKFFKKKSLSINEIYNIDPKLKSNIISTYIDLCKDIFQLYKYEFEKQFVRPKIDPNIMDQMLITKVKIKHVIFNSILKDFVVPILRNIPFTPFNVNKDNLSNSILSAITSFKESQQKKYYQIIKINKFDNNIDNYKNKINKINKNLYYNKKYY